MPFNFFDPEAEFGVSRRNLPHWFQFEATYFVTFRTADSLPAAVIERWAVGWRNWLVGHGIQPDDPNRSVRLSELPKPLQIEFDALYNEAFHQLLDAGHGECVLRRPDAARIVADAFRHFDGVRYHLSDFVVMPNHAHVLVGLLGDTLLADVCYSWKKYTANQINRLLVRRGHFWQGESFDHLVRSAAQFDYLSDYIAMNPEKAGLPPGEFVLYRAI